MQPFCGWTYNVWPSTRKLCIFTCLNIHLIYYNEPLIRWFFSLFRSGLCSDSEVDGNCFTNISFSTSLFRFCLMCLQQTNRLFSALFNFNGVVSTTKPSNLKPHQQYCIARWRDHYYSPAVCSTYSNKRILCLANVINIEDFQWYTSLVRIWHQVDIYVFYMLNQILIWISGTSIIR